MSGATSSFTLPCHTENTGSETCIDEMLCPIDEYHRYERCSVTQKTQAQGNDWDKLLAPIEEEHRHKSCSVTWKIQTQRNEVTRCTIESVGKIVPNAALSQRKHKLRGMSGPVAWSIRLSTSSWTLPHRRESKAQKNEMQETVDSFQWCHIILKTSLPPEAWRKQMKKVPQFFMPCASPRQMRPRLPTPPSSGNWDWYTTMLKRLRLIHNQAERMETNTLGRCIHSKDDCERLETGEIDSWSEKQKIDCERSGDQQMEWWPEEQKDDSDRSGKKEMESWPEAISWRVPSSTCFSRSSHQDGTFEANPIMKALKQKYEQKEKETIKLTWISISSLLSAVSTTAAPHENFFLKHLHASGSLTPAKRKEICEKGRAGRMYIRIGNIFSQGKERRAHRTWHHAPKRKEGKRQETRQSVVGTAGLGIIHIADTAKRKPSTPQKDDSWFFRARSEFDGLHVSSSGLLFPVCMRTHIQFLGHAKQ